MQMLLWKWTESRRGAQGMLAVGALTLLGGTAFGGVAFGGVAQTDPPTAPPAAPAPTPTVPDKPAAPPEKPASPDAPTTPAPATPTTPAPPTAPVTPATAPPPTVPTVTPTTAPAPTAEMTTLPVAPTKRAAPTIASDVYIEVNSLRNVAGAAYKGPDGRPLTERLASALQVALADSARKQYQETDPTDDHGVQPNAARFVVEGDIAALEIGEPMDRPYMIVARLYREGKPRQLIAQFAGNARSLRDLTGNLTRQQGIGTTGLTGEMAREILLAAKNARPLPVTWDAMVSAATAKPGVTVDVLRDEGDAKSDPTPLIPAGSGYRLRVNAPESGSIYLVEIDPTTKRPTLRTDDAEGSHEVTPGQPAVLPTIQPALEAAPATTPAAPDASGVASTTPATPPTASTASAAPPVPREYLVFVRKHGDAPVAATAPVILAAREVVTNRSSEGKNNAIQLLVSAPPSQDEALDPGVAKVLRMYASDPEGQWMASRVTVNFAPETVKAATPPVVTAPQVATP